MTRIALFLVLVLISACEPNMKPINKSGPELGTTNNHADIDLIISTRSRVPYTFVFDGHEEVMVRDTPNITVALSSQSPRTLVLRNDSGNLAEFKLWTPGDQRMTITRSPVGGEVHRVKRFSLWLVPNTLYSLTIQGHLPNF